ncbi:signal peptide peptidase SppA [Leptotrichia sp. OH3620_COT-345]|uniref:signal peptide peptidase SppA n=1 Tax=Leptotrichia sp. OH3620_COT-345 TaxID=2491048 RepID=UPI000F653D01|nr:signal peptide peptidase SppA [Leptotrichia sp. OH3620_COT-345]RRD39408.1 signal peptide peptidase SppA [Leptotrichia sp. OH3620_COT-345]
MKFFDFIKKFFIFTIKEIYSFFLKLSLLFLVFFLLSVSLISFFASKVKLEEDVPKNYSYVMFNVSNISEDKLDTSFFGETAKYNISYADILSSLEDIKNNDNIKGIIINLDQVNLSSTKSEEIIKKLNEIKSNNKKIYAFGAYIENYNFPIASVASEIIMIPSASADVSLTGYHYSELYYKKLFDKLGVNMEVVRIGDFKSYGENYTSNLISPELKSEITRILENRYNNFLETISKTRNIDKNILNNDILNGNTVNLTPFTARDKNLVDKLENFGEFLQRLGINDENIIDIYDYYTDNSKRMESEDENKQTIAVIYAEGPIVYNQESDGAIYISPDNMAKKLKELSNVKNLKGVVLRVNSPGGSALASEIIYQMFSKLEVPVYVSMSEVAASGGYYISMTGNKVFGNKSTITGSIGVVSMLPKFHNAQNKYGITSNSISKGKYSDTFDPFVPLSGESRNKIIESMNTTYKEFKSRVTENRKISESTLEEYAQGKIWLGDEAREINLIDGIATLDETVKLLAKDLKLENYNVKNIYAKKDFKETLRLLSSFIFEKFNLTSQIEAKIPGSSKILDDYKLIENNQNKPMYYLPYKMNIY